jgi:DNA-binding transcriptional LysR family regulator
VRIHSLTEPSVSAQVKSVERLLGLTLFSRGRGQRTVKLTTAGEVLLRATEDAMAALENGVSQLHKMRGEPKRIAVHVGVSPPFGGYALAPLQKRFQESHPELELGVVVGSRIGVAIRRGSSTGPSVSDAARAP